MLGLHGMKRFVVLVILAFINQAKGNAGIKKSKQIMAIAFLELFLVYSFAGQNQ